MSEFERLLHLFVSLQILFGSRRGSLLVPLLIVVIGVGGYVAWRYYSNADRPLAAIDADWDTGDSQKRIDCIREYKQLLQKKDPLEPHRFFLKHQRERIYRRIITHHVKFDLDTVDAADWIRMARDEGFDSPARLEIIDEKVIEFWNKTVDAIEDTRRNNNRSARQNRADDRSSGLPSDNNPSPAGAEDASSENRRNDGPGRGATASDSAAPDSADNDSGNGESGDSESDRVEIPGLDDQDTGSGTGSESSGEEPSQNGDSTNSVSTTQGGSASTSPVSTSPVSADPVSADPVSADPVSADPARGSSVQALTAGLSLAA